MAKCICSRTIGISRNTEIAVRADGVQFSRDYGFNGYANAWSKWQVVPLAECITFEESHFSDVPKYRLPDAEFCYARNTYYSAKVEYTRLPLVVIYVVEDKYSDNNGAYQVAYGLDENGNFTCDSNMYSSNQTFLKAA